MPDNTFTALSVLLSVLTLNYITAVETWIYSYGPETKQRSSQEPRKEDSKAKMMLISLVD
jgi:hypothetical protein